jgi:hypothetical protein
LNAKLDTAIRDREGNSLLGLSSRHLGGIGALERLAWSAVNRRALWAFDAVEGGQLARLKVSSFKIALIG